MSVLSDRDLAALYPEYRGAIGPASIDLSLGDSLLFWPRHIPRDPRLDQKRLWQAITLGGSGLWVLEPGYRYLAATRERICIPDDHAAQIGARSSWGRDGLAVIQGPAGWFDPGYAGNPTLELSVVGSDLVIWPGARVAQLILFRLTSPAERPYRGKYLNDTAPTPSRSHLDGEARP